MSQSIVRGLSEISPEAELRSWSGYIKCKTTAKTTATVNKNVHRILTFYDVRLLSYKPGSSKRTHGRTAWDERTERNT